MRISELARCTDVPVGTIKYYLREGLLPPGEAVSATQARYNEFHVARLRLIRALLVAGNLPVSKARAVLAVIDDPASSIPDALAAAHSALPTRAPADQRPDLHAARAHLQRWGWQVSDQSPGVVLLAQALEALGAVGFDVTDALLDRYASAAGELGQHDVAETPTTSAAEAVAFVVAGTLLLEPVLLALRRLAQEDAAHRRFGP